MTLNEAPRRTPWLTVEQAAERLQVHPNSIYSAIKAGKLKAIKLGARRQYRVHEEWIDAFAEASATLVNPDAPGAAHRYAGAGVKH